MDFIKYLPIFAFVLNSLSYICCEYELRKVIFKIINKNYMIKLI